MKFEVITNKGIALMSCTTASCIPSLEQLKSISDAGHKFRINGKIMSIKKVQAFKEQQNIK